MKLFRESWKAANTAAEQTLMAIGSLLVWVVLIVALLCATDRVRIETVQGDCTYGVREWQIVRECRVVGWTIRLN